MKKLLVSVLAIAGLVACSQDTTLVQNSNNGTLMEFNVAALDNATRVDPSITLETLDGFDVWAYVDTKEGTVLTEERVSLLNGAWSYVNKQYWTPGHNYYFTAIAPVEPNNWAYNQAEDTIAFTNVEGTEDLLLAEKTVVTPETLGESMPAVGLQFNHLLSKVKFTFKNGFTTDNVYVAVENVEMDVPAAGTYTTTTGAWALENGSTTLAFGNVTDGETLDIEGTTVFAAQKSVRSADERFTIPAGADQNYVVRFTVKHYNGNVCLSTSHKEVNISGLNLEKGKAYNFVTEINEQNAADAALLPIEFEVECVNDWNHTDVDSAEAFANALKAETSSIHVTLTQDIDVAISSLGTMTGGSGEYKLGGENTESITIDLNGKKLNIETTYWSNLGAKNNDAVFTIKNGTMTSSQPTGTWNSYDLTFSNCNYIIEDVDFEKAIAFANTGKSVSLKDVTIKETHDYYAMWICAEGMNVNIDNLTINSLGRGIKIDEQYVGAPAKVTLNVKNSKFTTANKAAILVKSAAGAEINVENIDIAGVAADNEFAVWVDEDAAAYADKVVVNGAMVKVEGSAAQLVTSNDELATAVNNGATKVYLADGTYTLATYPAGVELVGYGDNVVLDVKGKKYGVNGNVTIENVKILFSNDNYKGFQHTNVESYKNCTIVGQPFLYGNDVTFEGCTFEQTSASAYNVWTYGAKAVKFVDCVFNSAGKSVLIYTESGNGQTVLFEGCELNASAPAEGKAAIEIDSSLIKGVYDITINDTTATGFANGNVSGNSLWNNKKGDKATITVDGVKVL